MEEGTIQDKPIDSVTLDEGAKGEIKRKVHIYRKEDETDTDFANRVKILFKFLKEE